MQEIEIQIYQKQRILSMRIDYLFLLNYKIIKDYYLGKEMLQFLGLDDNKKMGMVLLIVSAFLYFFGMILFFARSLLLLSNIFFFGGLYFFIGLKGLFKFFVKKGKIRGSIVYFAGFILVILNFALLGAITQIIGIILIFRTFLPDLYEYSCRIPVAGKYLKSYWVQNALQKLAGTQNRI